MAHEGTQACPTGVEKGTTTITAGMPAYLDIHPIADYEPVGQAGTAWIGLCRQYSSRQLVLVQKIYQTTASDIKRFVQLGHLHIARPIALYSTGAEMHVAYEYIELGLRDLLPLSETEVAVIMSQILDAVYYLIQNKMGFRILTIRVSSKGHVKIVPDWDFETNMTTTVRLANKSYLALYLGEKMLELCPTPSPECSSFISELSSGELLLKDHSFLIRVGKANPLINACRFAIQRKLAGII